MGALNFETNGNIAILTMDRPASRNAMGQSGDGAQFAEFCQRINKDTAIRCAVMTGAGRAFSAGGDLKAMVAKEGLFSGPPTRLRESYRTGIQQIIRALWTLEVPLIAAVNGPAIGLGNDIAVTADIRLAARSARFGATFINAGLVPGDGGAWLLPRAIGRSRAAELLFSCEVIDANTAEAWGLVSKVVDDDKLMPEALRLAKQIADKPPIQVRMTKQMMRQAENADLNTILEMSACLQALAQNTDDHALALNAILNKTHAEFKGE